MRPSAPRWGWKISISGGGAECSSLPRVAMCLNAGAMGRRDAETETLIPTHGGVFDVETTHTLRGEGFDASEDGTGRGTPLVPVCFSAGDAGNDVGFDIAPTLRKGGEGGGNQPAIAFTAKDYGADAMEDCSPTLRAGGFTGSHANGGVMPAVAIPLQEVGKRTGVSTDDPRAGIGIGKDGDPMFTLQAGAQHGVAFDLRGREGGAQFEGPHDTANIRAASGGSSRSYVAASAVRRLTPTECERLQGFPDGFTQIPWRGKAADDCPDGPRYKALGNSMAVPVMRWIGERIAAVDEMV